MAESEYQLHPLIYAISSLKAHFQSRQDVYVVGDMFLYYEKGDPAAVVAPDVFVVLGADNHLRDSYMLWKEPKGPDFVMEITSQSTRSRDQGTKRGLYEYLGVTEYFCFDPTFDYLKPPLCGYRLQDGQYKPITPTILTPAHVVLDSQTLGLSLRLLDGEFRFLEPQTGRVLINYAEALEQRDIVAKERDMAVKRGAEERVARQRAEARLREVEAQLAALSGNRDDGKTSDS